MEKNNLALSRCYTVPCLLTALLSVSQLPSILRMDVTTNTPANSILSVLLLVGLFCLFRRAAAVFHKRLTVFALIAGLFFAATMTVGSNLLKQDASLLHSWRTWLTILGVTPVFAAATGLLFHYLPRINARLTPGALSAPLGRLSGLTGHQVFFLAWGLIFLAWLPGFIASYPGVYGYDCVYQIEAYLAEETSLHHPLISTYLLGFFVITVGNLMGSVEVGMCLYSLLQMLCLSAAFAAVCAWLKRRQVSLWIRLCVLLIMMFLPTNAIMSFSGTKDVLFTAATVMLALYLAEMLQDAQWLHNPLHLAKLALASFFFVAFRNQALYVFVPIAIWIALLLRRHWKSVLAWLLVFILLTGLYRGPVTWLANGQSSSTINEMMSVPCMQLSRALLHNKAELTAEEQALIAAYIPQHAWYEVNKGIADQMKNSFDARRFTDNPGEFIGLWLRVGLKCPTAYLDAFLRVSIGLWYPDMPYRDPYAYHPYWEYDNTPQNADGTWIIPQRQPPPGMQWLSDYYHSLSYENTYQKVPVVSMLYSSGLIGWCVLLFFLWCVYARQYRLLPLSLLPLLLWGTLLLGPVVLYRYVFPLAATLPILLGTALTPEE